MTLLPQQNVLFLWLTTIFVVTISLVTATTVIVLVGICIFTTDIVTTTILVSYINKTFCWGNKIIFSVKFLVPLFVIALLDFCKPDQWHRTYTLRLT